MSIHLETKDLINAQQMEVSVNGPDGATHLILCTGIVGFDSCGLETFTFFVGPQLSRRQFVTAIASGALTAIETYDKESHEINSETELRAKLVRINANFDNEAGQVKVSAEIASNTVATKLAISYNVNILAELSIW